MKDFIIHCTDKEGRYCQMFWQGKSESSVAASFRRQCRWHTLIRIERMGSQ